jgi:hypothetical protein
MNAIVCTIHNSAVIVKDMKYCNHIILALLFAWATYTNLVAQAKMRKLPGTINHPSINVYAPYLSADANALVFISDNAEDNALAPFYTFRDNADWREPQMFPKSIYTRLNFLKGFALSGDGKMLLYTTMKSPGVGGFDIWTSEWKGTAWTEPVNLGLPINTKGHEGSPSLAADGSALYFMRCEKMDPNKAENCKLFRCTKKPNGQWDEPAELPAVINTGNSQAPRIMADGETLIFSSDKMKGGKGGMDLYTTKFINGNWNTPVPLDFANTDKDDQYVSVAALGRYLVKDVMGQRKNELVEILIPDQLRPKGMMKIDGKVLDPAGKSIPAYISLVDLPKNKRVYSGRPYPDGSFIVYVMEGSKYELSIDPEQDNISYFSKQFDLMSDKIPQIEKVSATLKPLAAGDELPLEMIKFKPNSSDVDIVASSTEAKRFIRAVKANPNLKFEIQVLLSGYVEDSVRSNPDLTEVTYDSIHTTYDDIDSLGQLYKHDTVLVKTTYHNDRTWSQAKSLVQYLVSQGLSESSFAYFGNAIPAALPENRKLTVKALARPKK